MVLFVNACMRGEESRTLSLCRDYLHDLEEKGAEVIEVNLPLLSLKPFDGEMLSQRTQLANKGSYDDEIFDLARQLALADEVVIGAPYWDLTFPAALKTYIEHVCVSNITFHYTSDACYEGLCRARHTTYVTTSGGFLTYADGDEAPLEPSPGKNLGYDYICGISEMLGLGPVRYIAAEGLDVDTTDVSVQMFRARSSMADLLKQE